MRRVHDRRVNQHVVVNELGGACRVREDAAHSSGNEEDIVGAIGTKPVTDGSLIAEIELIAGCGEQPGCTGPFESSNDGRANQPSATSDEYAGVEIHGSKTA